jgi:hypothetical protein
MPFRVYYPVVKLSVGRLKCQGGKVKVKVLQEQLRSEHGQSLTEIALFVPILLLMIVGFVEIGVYINAYINTVDATRAAARYVAPQDPIETQCRAFGSYNTNLWVSLSTACTQSDYKIQAQTVRTWGMENVRATCQGYTQTNFYYVAGCMAILNSPKEWFDPTPKHIFGPGDDYPGDDIIITTIPITAGAPTTPPQPRVWTLYDRQPTAAFPSAVITITNPGANDFTYQQSFLDNLQRFAGAPSTGVVVVEAYHAQPQLTKLFTIVNQLAGSRAWLPDPIPIHAYSIFPVAALDPARYQ